MSIRLHRVGYEFGYKPEIIRWAYSFLHNIVTYRSTARQQLSVHGSDEHATMGAVFSVDHVTARC
jgi:hypothetical protein